MGDLGDGIHDGGPEDPRIGVIKVVTRTATYAITTGNVVGRGLEIAKGAVTGESPKVNKLREISEEEINECKYFYLCWLVGNKLLCVFQGPFSIFSSSPLKNRTN